MYGLKEAGTYDSSYCFGFAGALLLLFFILVLVGRVWVGWLASSLPRLFSAPSECGSSLSSL